MGAIKKANDKLQNVASTVQSAANNIKSLSDVELAKKSAVDAFKNRYPEKKYKDPVFRMLVNSTPYKSVETLLKSNNDALALLKEYATKERGAKDEITKELFLAQLKNILLPGASTETLEKDLVDKVDRLDGLKQNANNVLDKLRGKFEDLNLKIDTKDGTDSVIVEKYKSPGGFSCKTSGNKIMINFSKNSQPLDENTKTTIVNAILAKTIDKEFATLTLSPLLLIRPIADKNQTAKKNLVALAMAVIDSGKPLKVEGFLSGEKEFKQMLIQQGATLDPKTGLFYTTKPAANVDIKPANSDVAKLTPQQKSSP